MEAWSIAHQELKLSDEEWGDLTPKHIHALRKRQIEQLQREELLIGIIASTSANFSFCKPEHPLSPELFMLHPFPQPPPPPPMTGEEIMAAFRNFPKTKPIEVAA